MAVETTRKRHGNEMRRITQREILALMRACDSGGVIQVTPGQARTIESLLKARGATAQQAARAAQILGWAGDSPYDWPDLPYGQASA